VDQGDKTGGNSGGWAGPPPGREGSTKGVAKNPGSSDGVVRWVEWKTKQKEGEGINRKTTKEMREGTKRKKVTCGVGTRTTIRTRAQDAKNKR